MASVDILNNVGDQEDLDISTAAENRTWHITQYLRSEDDSDYDERHALSQALAAWNFDIVSVPAALSLVSLVLGMLFPKASIYTWALVF